MAIQDWWEVKSPVALKLVIPFLIRKKDSMPKGKELLVKSTNKKDGCCFIYLKDGHIVQDCLDNKKGVK